MTNRYLCTLENAITDCDPCDKWDYIRLRDTLESMVEEITNKIQTFKEEKPNV